MEMHNAQAETQEEAAYGVQEENVTMQSDAYSLEVNDGSHSDSNGSHRSHPKRRRGRQAYTLAFKLSVVEAYRNNGECKGNQRATARKFHIHRRQVQRWLRDERALSQRFKSHIAVANLTSRDSEKADVSYEALCNNNHKPEPSSGTSTNCETVQNVGRNQRNTAGRKRKIVDMVSAKNESPFGDGPQKEDAVIDLSMPRPRDAIKEQVISNTVNKNPQPSVKLTVLAAYHSANKWHGITAGVAQKFGIMVCDLRRWLKEEQESNALNSSTTVLRRSDELSNDTVPPSNGNGDVGKDAALKKCSTVQKSKFANAKAQEYTQQAHAASYERNEGRLTDLPRKQHIYVEAVLTVETLRYLYWQFIQGYFVPNNVMGMGTFHRCSIVPHVRSTINSLPQLVFRNSQFPTVHRPTPQTGQQNRSEGSGCDIKKDPLDN